MLEQVLNCGKTALSRSDHRSWALGMAVWVGEREGPGATRQTKKEEELDLGHR